MHFSRGYQTTLNVKKSDDTDKDVRRGGGILASASADGRSAGSELLSYVENLDNQCARVVQSDAIRLLSIKWLREGEPDSEETHHKKANRRKTASVAVTKMSSRQALEKLEASGEAKPFLTSEAASALLKSGKREVGVVVCGWTSEMDPDVSGAYLAAVRRFIRSPAGAHIKGLFWDFASIYMLNPRTDAQEATYRQGVCFMADLFASIFATTVLRCTLVPRRPPGYDGDYVERPFLRHGWCRLASIVCTEGLSRATEHPHLASTIERLPGKAWDIDGDVPKPVPATSKVEREGKGSKFEAVLRSLGECDFRSKSERATVLFLFREVTTKFVFVMQQAGEVAFSGSVPYVYAGEQNGAGRREGRGVLKYDTGEAYEGGFKGGLKHGVGFHRRANGDLYHDCEFASDLAHGSGCVSFINDDEFDGEFHAGKQEGRGRMRAVGSVYEGEWRAGLQDGRGVTRYSRGNCVYEGAYCEGRKEGHGRFRYQDGEVYEGEWKADNRQGKGWTQFADGGDELSLYEWDSPVGSGARWSADRSMAWLLEDGQKVKEFSLVAAAKVAKRIGLSPPEGAEPPPVEEAPGAVARRNAKAAGLAVIAASGSPSSVARRRAAAARLGPNSAARGGGGQPSSEVRVW